MSFVVEELELDGEVLLVEVLLVPALLELLGVLVELLDGMLDVSIEPVDVDEFWLLLLEGVVLEGELIELVPLLVLLSSVFERVALREHPVTSAISVAAARTARPYPIFVIFIVWSRRPARRPSG